MGLFDELIDARGRTWQTKDGLSEMQVYHPGDLFPAERTVSWVGLVGDDEEGGVVRAVGERLAEVLVETGARYYLKLDMRRWMPEGFPADNREEA